jgi:hypothetical protein
VQRYSIDTVEQRITIFFTDEDKYVKFKQGWISAGCLKRGCVQIYIVYGYILCHIWMKFQFKVICQYHKVRLYSRLPVSWHILLDLEYKHIITSSVLQCFVKILRPSVKYRKNRKWVADFCVLSPRTKYFIVVSRDFSKCQAPEFASTCLFRLRHSTNVVCVSHAFSYYLRL